VVSSSSLIGELLKSSSHLIRLTFARLFDMLWQKYMYILTVFGCSTSTILYEKYKLQIRSKHCIVICTSKYLEMTIKITLLNTHHVSYLK